MFLNDLQFCAEWYGGLCCFSDAVINWFRFKQCGMFIVHFIIYEFPDRAVIWSNFVPTAEVINHISLGNFFGQKIIKPNSTYSYNNIIMGLISTTSLKINYYISRTLKFFLTNYDKIKKVKIWLLVTDWICVLNIIWIKSLLENPLMTFCKTRETKTVIY